jgi:hypothetical protein
VSIYLIIPNSIRYLIVLAIVKRVSVAIIGPRLLKRYRVNTTIQNNDCRSADPAKHVRTKASVENCCSRYETNQLTSVNRT